MRDLPAHHQHQAKPKEEEKESRDTILNADDFVIGRKNVGAPETRILTMRFVDPWMRNSVSSGHDFYFVCNVKSAYLALPSPDGR